MAKVISNQQQVIAEPWWAKAKIVYIGLAIGVFWWLVTLLLQNYVVEPLACRDISTATTCVNAAGVSGSIATVLAAVLGTFVLIRYIQPRPIIISVGTAVVLWEFSVLMNGLSWWVTLIGAAVIYALCYLLFSMIARTRWLLLSIFVALVIVASIRIILIL